MKEVELPRRRQHRVGDVVECREGIGQREGAAADQERHAVRHFREQREQRERVMWSARE
jgi:hypothetical protein